tara:strand:- start:606 stop:1028 length:423 start_codon:yes stop_codon:yes gene_type:complete
MVKECIYCSCEIGSHIPIDVCQRCGIGVWGEKMFNAIISGMNNEKEKGNMELGRVGEEEIKKMEETESLPETFVEKEIISAHHKTKSVDEFDLTPKPIVVEDTIEVNETQILEMGDVTENSLEQPLETEVDIDFNSLGFN